MKKRLLSLLLAVVLCIGLLPVGALAEDGDVTVYPDDVDAKGDIIKTTSFDRTGPVLKSSDTSLSGKFYIVQGAVTIDGDLTIDGSKNGGLVLCEGATLTVKGALIHSGGNKFYIYGSSFKANGTGERGTTGRLIIQNSTGDGAALRAKDGAYNPQLGISSGELEIHGEKSGKLVENVVLYSDKNIHEGTLDGTAVSPSVWGAASVPGKELVIEYCEHDHATYERSGATQHTKHCADCGFAGPAVNCGSNGYEGWKSIGNEQHREICPCGNLFGDEEPCTINTFPTDDGKGHTTMCQYCNYTTGDAVEPHDTDGEDGECSKCGFKRVAFSGSAENPDALYNSLQTAFEMATDGGTITLTEDIMPSENITFGEYLNDDGEWVKPGYSVTLVMAGHTLTGSTGQPALTVSGGSLTIADNATLNGQDAGSAELPASSAVKVTDGVLTFNGTVNATGGSGNSSAAPAIEVTGGKVIFEGDVTATGGLLGQDKNSKTCQPAIKATGTGKLDFQGTKKSQVGLTLYGGLTVTGDATLTHGLTGGSFYSKPDGALSTTGYAVSAVGSNVYKNETLGNVNKLLADKHVFVKIRPEGENDKYLTTSYQYLAWDVTIEEHEHEFDAKNGYKCKCGVTCDHRNAEGKLDFSNDGKCPTCGKPCEHGNVDSYPTGHICRDCGQKMLVQNTFGSRDDSASFKFAYFTSLKDAMAAATEDGWTVKLLDNIDDIGRGIDIYEKNSGTQTITLDLNGKNITGSNPIWIGKPNNNIISTTTLKIVGSGNISLGNSALIVSEKSTLNLEGWTRGTIDIVSVSCNGNTGDEGSLIVGENDKNDIYIGKLLYQSWSLSTIKKAKLSGGTYGSINMTLTDFRSPGILFGTLLVPGYAFQYADGSGSFVNYATKATYDAGGVIYNVKVVKCTTHEDTKSVDANGNITDGADNLCDYCNADLTAATVATLTVDGKTYFYTDLPSALKAASSKGGTVKLQKDVENVSEMLVIEGFLHVTLDLNGKKITGNGSNSTLLGISNFSDVTICDSGTTGQIKCTASGYAVYVSEGCDLTISGGTFEGTDDATMSALGYAVGVDGAKLIITGGTFNSPVDAKDKLIVSGGTFKKAVTISARGAKITGGTFESAFSMSAQPDEFSGGTFKQQAVFSNVSNILTGGEFQKGIKSTDKKLYELLAENKAYQTADDWLDDNTTYFYNDTGSSVTVAEAPIHSVTLTVNGTSVELDEDNKGRFSVELGTDVTLTASCEGSMEAPYGTWYPTLGGEEDGSTGSPVKQGPGKSLSYTLPSNDLTVGTHTYRVSFCSENPGSLGQVTGYYKVAQITITVTPRDLKNARVEYYTTDNQTVVTYNPLNNHICELPIHEVTLGGVELKEGTDYNIFGNTAAEVGKYTAILTAKSDSTKCKGTLKIEWEVVPYALPEPSFEGNQMYTKIYDGSTNLPKEYKFQALFLAKEPGSSLVDWKEDENNYEVTAAGFVSPDAGENKPINQTITLKNENFVFEPTAKINVKGITTTDRTITYKNFTLSEAYPTLGTTFNIKKADVEMTDAQKTVTLEVINDLEATYTVDLPTLPELKSPKTYGDITYTVASQSLEHGYATLGQPTVKQVDGKYQLCLTVPAFKSDKEIDIGTITVTIKTGNYKDVVLTVKLSTVNKPQPDVTVTAEPSTITYGTTLKDVKPVFTATCNGQSVDGTVRWAMPDRYMPNVSVKNLEWHFTPADSDAYRGAGDVTPITVKPADLTGQPTFEKITQSGKKLSEVGVITSGITGVNGETVSDWGHAFTWVDGENTIVQPNKSYSWTFKVWDKTYKVSNYNVLTGSVVLYPVSSGYSDQVKKQIEEFEAKKRGELPESDSAFRDVTEDDYFFDAVQWAAENGITSGVTANRFGPSQDCSRGQTMTFLWRAMGEPEPESYDSALADVPSGSYFHDAVHWAMGEGVTTGAGKGIFAPDATVTRGQFVTFLYRLANAKFDGTHPFADVPAGSYYEKAIAWAYAEGITKGISATKFAPDAPCTRAQIITFLYRYFNR